MMSDQHDARVRRHPFLDQPATATAGFTVVLRSAWLAGHVIAWVLALAVGLAAQAPAPPASAPQPPVSPVAAKPGPSPIDGPETPVVTRHELRAGGKTLKYTATTGYLPIRNAQGEVEAQIFFIAYTLDGTTDPAKRPLTVSFNGGPGSSSVWLHLGALGPKRVVMKDDGGMPAPPYRLVDNEATWLDQTDLVFVDPVGTGYSRATKADLGSKFWGVQGDIQSVGEFIRLYITRYDRWSSPLFMVGESYGTTRAAGLAGHLVDRGIAFNGILLVSSILNFQTARFTVGNDLPYVLFLPTYTATAFHHKRLAPELQRDLSATLKEVEAWATSDYTVALARGTALDGPARAAIAEKLARYTGLSKDYVERANLRIEIQRFCKELLRTEGRTVGRLDSRFSGFDRSGVDQNPDFDPSMTAIRPPYTAALNDHVRRALGFHSDMPYHILGGGIGTWDWGSAGSGFTDTGDALRDAIVKNPHMRVFVGSGYFDLATPYFATEYTLDHLGLPAGLASRITRRYYRAGHMMYIDLAELAALRRDVGQFFEEALGAQN
jgi:carboxypeptidase C (cathepsin A)